MNMTLLPFIRLHYIIDKNQKILILINKSFHSALEGSHHCIWWSSPKYSPGTVEEEEGRQVGGS